MICSFLLVRMAEDDELACFRFTDGTKTYWTVTSSGRVCLWDRDEDMQETESFEEMASAPEAYYVILKSPVKFKADVPSAYYGSSATTTKKRSTIKFELAQYGVMCLDFDYMILDELPNLHQYQSHDQLIHWNNTTKEKDITITNIISTYICCLFVFSL